VIHVPEIMRQYYTVYKMTYKLTKQFYYVEKIAYFNKNDSYSAILLSAFCYKFYCSVPLTLLITQLMGVCYSCTLLEVLQTQLNF